MGWLGGVITRQSQERTRDVVFDYRVQLEQDQSVRSVNLPLDSKRGGSCVGFARVKRGEADGGYS